MTLPEFLDSLPEGEQYAALVHLSVLWAERQGQKKRRQPMNMKIIKNRRKHK